MEKLTNIFIFGAGGHSKVVIDIIENLRTFRILAIVGNSETKQVTHQGYPVITEAEIKNYDGHTAVVAIGDNLVRSKVVSKVMREFPHMHFITLIHPSAIISKSVTIGTGTVIAAGAVVNPATTIGDHCIVNTLSSVDHDCIIGNYASIGPGSTLGGNVKIGDYTAISLGAKVIHNLEIGPHTIIGSGSTVVKKIPSEVIAFGTPCTVRTSRKIGDRYL